VGRAGFLPGTVAKPYLAPSEPTRAPETLRVGAYQARAIRVGAQPLSRRPACGLLTGLHDPLDGPSTSGQLRGSSADLWEVSQAMLP